MLECLPEQICWLELVGVERPLLHPVAKLAHQLLNFDFAGFEKPSDLRHLHFGRIEVEGFATGSLVAAKLDLDEENQAAVEILHFWLNPDIVEPVGFLVRPSFPYLRHEDGRFVGQTWFDSTTGMDDLGFVFGLNFDGLENCFAEIASFVGDIGNSQNFPHQFR